MCANCVVFGMGGKRDWVMLSLLIVGLSPLGHCAALKDGKKLESSSVLNTNTQRTRILGKKAGDQKLKSKVWPGRLIIGLKESAPEDYHNIPEGMESGNASPHHEPGYQSDQADWSDLQHLQGSVYGFGAPSSPAVQQLLGMRPKVECTEDFMRLKVHGSISAFDYGLLIDRGSVPPLPLSRVPLECGFRVQRRWRDLDFIVPYDGCYVLQERDAYVVPIRLCGLEAKLSCPLLNLAPSLPSVSCYPNGMIVKTQNVAPVEDLRVKVENQWQLLLDASPKCGYSIVSHPDGMVISAPYKPCMEEKNEMYSLHMAAKTEFSLFCPSLVPGLPLNLSSPHPPNLSDSVDGSTVDVVPTDASPEPTQRPTGWQWFGRPHQGYRPDTFKPKPSPTPSSWRGPWPTSVPSAATPQNVPGVHYPQFPETWYPPYPPYPRLTPTPAPPVLPRKPKPVQDVAPTSEPRPAFPDPSSEQLGDFGYPPPEVPRETTFPKYEGVPPPVSLGTYPFLYLGDPGPVNPPENIFVPAAQPYPPQYPPQYPRGPLPSSTVEPFVASGVLGLTGYHWAPTEMPPESGLPQGPQWPYPYQYPPRPALSPTAAPPFEASSVLGAAGSRYQDVSQTSSNPLGYPQCCQSPVMYSNCCPPPVIYHQHNHHHFDFSNPIFNHGATSRSTRNLTSKAFYHVAHRGSAQRFGATQNRGDYAHSLRLKDEIQQASAKPYHRFSKHTKLTKPTTRTQMMPDSSTPPAKPFWAGQVQPLLSGSSQNTPNPVAFAHLGNLGHLGDNDDKPRLGPAPNFGEFSAEYSRTNPQPVPEQVPEENAGPSLVEDMSWSGPAPPIISTSGQAHLPDPDPYVLLPHQSFQPNYRDPVNNIQRPDYINLPTYFSRDPSTQVVLTGLETRPEQQMQDRSLTNQMMINQGASEQTQSSEPQVQPSAHSQQQVPRVPGGPPSAPSSKELTEAPSMSLLQMLTGPFSQRWVPVVPPNQVEQAGGVRTPPSRLQPTNYQPHGLV
ncbi:uncharacterized protein C6orf132 homolog [Astyanax mexicanus]|uniref:uncharacterized protein C6orf132 homolog n=1 Tax=Astyanax mexicanus TaxID=7994 RepID=UPI0020CAF800|nr:uncharacterized protein C6orf132 homolog [Astyanax mexicanus]